MHKNLRFSSFAIFVLMLIATQSGFTQPVQITDQLLLNYIGSRQVLLEDARESIPINVGSAGENQVWDFRATPIVDSIFAVTEFLGPNDVTNADRFPEANLIEKLSTPDEPGFALFQYHNVTPSHFINLGDSTVFMSADFDTTIVTSQRDTVVNLPVSYNDMFFTFERDTSGFYPSFATISIDTTLNFIDGWGTIRLPLGDFECLRIRQDVKIINQQVINGVIASTTTDTYIAYEWLGADAFLLANAQSQSGDTNPNFTNANGFGRLDSLSTAPPTNVDDLKQLPTAFQLHQNYPNPFNPETVISYDLSEQQNVQVTVYNLLGQRIKSLLSQQQPAGHHEIVWNATDDAGLPVSSGVYIYRLKVAGKAEQTHKMLLLR